jgi:hypothetical protein
MVAVQGPDFWPTPYTILRMITLRMQSAGKISAKELPFEGKITRLTK